MKTNIFVLCLISLIIRNAHAAITCSGWNKQKIPIVLIVEETGKNVHGFKLVDVKKLIFSSISNPIDKVKASAKVIEGCQNALLAGSSFGQLNKNYNGHLYIECAGDGDAGFLELFKTGTYTYKGRFVAPNGKASLSLSDEEEVQLTCSAK